MPKLSEKVVNTAEPRETDYFIWDQDLPGFAVRVLPTGRKRYVVQ